MGLVGNDEFQLLAGQRIQTLHQETQGWNGQSIHQRYPGGLQGSKNVGHKSALNV